MSDLGINILAAFIWLILGFLASRAFDYYRRHRPDAFTAFTGFAASAPALHIVYGLVERSDMYPKFSADEGDVSALCAALSFAQRKFGIKKVRVVNSYAAQTTFASYESLLSVSGPVWNQISRYYLDLCPSSVGFTQRVVDGKAIDQLEASVGSGQAYTTSLVDGEPRECYALIISGSFRSLHGGKRQKVTVAGGISALGTFGAVHWLRSLDGCSWKDVFKERKKGRGDWRYAIVKVIDHSPKGFRSYASELETPTFLTLDLVDYQPISGK